MNDAFDTDTCLSMTMMSSSRAFNSQDMQGIPHLDGRQESLDKTPTDTRQDSPVTKEPPITRPLSTREPLSI